MSAAVACACLALARGLIAQTPPELVGRVRERGGAPLDGVTVELRETGILTWSDATGAFRLRANASGEYTVRFSRIGWAPASIRARLFAGTSVTVDVELSPTPLPLDAVIVSDRAGGLRLNRNELSQPGITTAGDAVARLPGVIMNSPVPGGPQLISVRGSSHDQVLVLVDGVAINDPITGVADLSRLSAASIESISLLPGARSAEHGARALAGVLVIETRRAGASPSLAAAAGSLGLWRLESALGGGSRLDWSAGGSLRSTRGTFDYQLPRELGSSTLERVNADARALDLFLTAAHALLHGTLRTRIGAQAEERGLPGRGYAPSPQARQELRALRASAAWQQIKPSAALRVIAAGTSQRSIYRDEDPPFGLPYDDSVFAHALDLRLDYSRTRGDLTAGAGAEARLQQINTQTLQPGIRQPRQFGAFLRGEAQRMLGSSVSSMAQVRVDYDDAQRLTYANYAASLTYAPSSSWASIAYRTGLNPPSLGDQFFRESVGVKPNPALRPEQVHEIELNAGWETRLRGAAFALSGAVFLADIRGLIVWAPDYRFIWSPDNEDVHRAGLELSAVARLERGWNARAQFSETRITYDRPSDRDVQVVYRPRHAAVLSLERETPRYGVRLETDYTGERNTTPSRLNPLPGFWTTAAAVQVRTRVLAWQTTSALRINRLLNETATLIFGYPDPGRTVTIEIRVGTGEPATTR